MTHPARNLQASLHQQLLNSARKQGRLFNDLIVYYAIERFLYRLSQSPYADRLILKGGLMLHVWQLANTRITRDIDLLGRLSNDPDQIAALIREIVQIPVEADGLTFDISTLVVRPIAEDAEYQGMRATFKANFGKVSISMQIDFGFSDSVTPAPVPITYPCLLQQSSPQLMAYNRETVIAEKFEAMVKHGELNSRMRDFYDVWLLSRHFRFTGDELSQAIHATFERRETSIELEPVCFSEAWASSAIRTSQWKGFIKTARVSSAPETLAEVIAEIRLFLQPVVRMLTESGPTVRSWSASGPWQ